MNQLIKYFDQPYPFYYKGRKLIQISIVIFVLSFFFNYVIQPFETNPAELKLSNFWVAFIHSINPLILLPLFSFVFIKIEAPIENWKLKYEFLFIIVLLIVAGTFQFLVRDILYDNPNNWSWFYVKKELINTFIVGSILAFLVVSVNLNIQFYKNSEQASAFNLNLKEKTTVLANTEIYIETELKSESFQLDTQQFVFAQAQGNYVELWICNDLGTKSILKRLKLKDLETSLQAFPNMVRTHRSYLVNIDYIQNLNGNAQGYKLHLKNCKEIIPVSRNYLASFNQKLQSE